MAAPQPGLFDPKRLAALHRLGLLDSPPEAGFDRVTRLAAQIVGAPVCLVSLVDDHRQFFKSAVGLGGPVAAARETPLTHSFCQHVVNSGAPLVVNDAPAHPQVCDNLAIRDLGVMAYLGVPIRSPDGFVLGSFCVIDSRPRAWLPDDVARVQEFAGLVETEVALRAALVEQQRTLEWQRALLDGTDFSVIATDSAGLIGEFNAGAERMLGYRADEIVGRQTLAYFHVPADLAARAAALGADLDRRIPANWEVVVTLARLDRTEAHEWTWVRKDGARLTVMLTVSALRDQKGAITGYLAIAQDNSERYQAQDALASLAELQLRTGEMAKVGGWELDLATMRLKWSPETCRIHEVDPPVAPSLESAINFYAPEARPTIEAAVQACIATATPWDLELPLITAKGRRIWARAQGRAVCQNGKPIKLLGAFQDITQRREAEMRLVQSEKLLTTVTGILPGLVAYWTADLRCAFANSEYRLWFGKSPAEMHGIGMAELLGQELFRSNEPYVRGALAGREQRFERQLITKDGDVRQTWAQYIPDFEPDQVTVKGFVVLVSDISATKAQEQVLRTTAGELAVSATRFRTLTQNAPVGIFETDAHGGCLLVNERWSLLAGRTSDEAAGNGWSEALHPEDRATIFTEWSAFSRGERPFQMEYRFLHRDGRVVWVAGSAVALRDPAGKLTGYLGTVSDITARKELESNLALARDQALEASRLKSEFLATMSHEIRTPMNAVIGMAGLLADTELNPEQQEMARTMVGGAETLLSIINDILDFSRIEAGRMRLDPVDFDFCRVVDETLALLAPRAHEKGVELTCEFVSSPRSLLLGDSGRVRQVLTNLIGNAIKFTDVGEVAIVVRTLAGRAQFCRLRVEVRDTGVGIPREAQARLFQPFTQADGSTTRRFGGTGLGLAISRQLVELMGGEIGFASEPGHGSLFWFELEFARRAVAPAVPVAAVLPGTRVLVVDDNETNRRILVGQLSHWNVQVEAVADAPTALARLREPHPTRWQLVLLDWHMPAMSGLDLAMEIRADPALADLPLVMLSSAGALADIGTATAAGFAAFLSKPVTAQQLSRCLSRVLAEASATPTAPSAQEPDDTTRRRGLHLLLAEDNPANQRVATMLLEKMGHTVEVAAHGQLALTKLATQEFDAVLMDCQMPVLDGYATTRQIRAGTLPGVNRLVPIIALTAYARTEDRARCLEAGMDDYVTKPIRAAELRTALERCAPLRPAGLDAAGVARRETNVPGVFDEEALETVRSLPGAEGPSLLPEMVRLYLRDDHQLLDQLDRLAAQRHGESLAEQAHCFGGNAASFGGAEVRRVALSLEQAALADDWKAAAVDLERLRAACGRLRTEVARRKLDEP